MSKHAVPDDETPFSYRVKVGHISANPVTVTISADPRECEGLARLWQVDKVLSLSAELQINRWKKDGVRLRGTLDADIVQSCVVTLEPVPSHLHEEIDQIFVPEGSKLAKLVTDADGALYLDPEGPDAPDMFVGDEIDAGAVVAEFAALAIDPYPRKSGIDFKDHVEDDGSADRKANPFAVLKDWKKD